MSAPTGLADAARTGRAMLSPHLGEDERQAIEAFCSDRAPLFHA